MFGKAKIKRFNDEVGIAPAPNAYDSKLPSSKKSGFAITTSRRFDEKKDVTPGPGQYLTVPDKSIRASPQVLKRSASFRVNSLVKRDSRLDLSNRNELFKTPVSTPRRLRRSISTGDVTVNQSPHLKKDDIAAGLGDEDDKPEESVETLKTRIVELEQQLNDAMDKLLMTEDSVVVKFNHETVEEELKSKVDQLETELETLKDELRLRDEDREQSERLAQQLDSLKLQSDYAYTLKSENELLNQDIKTLEEELTKSKEERDQIESELTEMRTVRKDLDAKNVFLHFTQEQLNAQVISLESVVRNLKTENHLLNKGIKNLVEQVQSEKKKFEELSEQYNSENAEAEMEFKNLEVEMEENKIKAKNLEIELRAKLGEAEFEKCELTNSIEELKKDLEVSENDKTVLKDQLQIVEKSINEMALDLAEVSKQKQEICDLNNEHNLKIASLESNVEEQSKKLNELSNELTALNEENDKKDVEIKNLLKRSEENENELKEVEMSKVGLEGANAALEEEVIHLEEKINLYKSQSIENENHISALEKEVSQLDASVKDLKSQVNSLETEREKITEELNDVKISKQEVEESLLDTQGLVEDMEIKLMDAHSNHKEEANDLADKLKKTTSSLENVKDERSKLLEMNTALSGQVAEALHSIHNLQIREDNLGQELVLVKQFLEAAQEEGEEDRIRMMQSEDEILSLQAELEDVYIKYGEVEARSKQVTEVNGRLQANVEKLNAEMSASKEDNKAQLNTLKAAYNSAVSELNESKNVGMQLLEQLGSMEEELNAKKAENSRILKDFEDRNEEALNEMDKMVQGFEQEKGLLHDNIKHLENLRDNLEKTVSEKTEVIHTHKHELEESRRKEEFSLNKVEEFTKTNLRLKGNLELRATENLKLKEQVERLAKECEETKSSLESNNIKMKELSAQKADIERHRTAELEMCIGLRDKLAKAEMDIAAGESAVRSMEAQQVIVMETEAKVEEERLKNEELVAVVRKYKERLEEMEVLMSQMDERNEELEAKAKEASDQLKVLEDMIEPFKEQLEGFEMEKKALLSSQEASKEEVSKLSNQYSSLLGHQNHSQKIKHVVQLKQENVTLKSRVESLQLELTKAHKSVSKWEQKYNEAAGLKRFDPRLSFQPTPKNKENFQTPITTVKESRKSTGSPLSRVNRH